MHSTKKVVFVLRGYEVYFTLVCIVYNVKYTQHNNYIVYIVQRNHRHYATKRRYVTHKDKLNDHKPRQNN